jgi:hypothetical protein
MAWFLIVCFVVSAAVVVEPHGASAVTPILPPIDPIIVIDPVVVSNQKVVYSIPLYRLKRTIGTTSWHTYTANETNRNTYKSSGWVDDGIVCYVAPVPFSGVTPLYKWTLGGKVTYLTINSSGDGAGSAGYVYVGHVGYVAPTSLSGTGYAPVYRFRRMAGGIMADYYHTPVGTWSNSSYAPMGVMYKGWASKVALQQVTVTPFASGLTGGSNVLIKWNTTRSGGVAELLYTQDNGASWVSIVKNRPNASTNQYEWTVPNITSSNCYVMVRWSPVSGYPASAWSVCPKFSITKNVILPTPLLPPIWIDLQPATPTALATTAGTTATPTIHLFWEDNSVETGFVIERKSGSAAFAQIALTAADAITYADATVVAGTTYTYRVKAKGALMDSEYSNEASGVYAADPESLVPEPTPSTLAVPTNLQGVRLPGTEKMVRLTWVASSSASVVGYSVERSLTGTWSQVAALPATALTYVDADLADPSLTTASYRVKAADELTFSDPSNVATVSLTAPVPEPPATKVIVLRVGRANYTINGVAAPSLDAAPVIIESRTLLPIRAIVEGLGGAIAWDPVESKVTATLGSNVVEVWINNHVGRVNGVYTQIDAGNPLVKPILVPPGRTMLPVRFVTENLGCGVGWVDGIQEITITYPKPAP